MAFSTSNQPTINVTPLIDVLLVLLIIFMVVVNTDSVGLDAKVPQPPKDNAVAPVNLQDIIVIVRGDQTVELNQQPIAFADLEARFKDIFRTRGNHVVFVGAAGDLDFEPVMQVMDLARGAGLDQIALLPYK
ncbi:MAG: biopolymer transporter ExbD [Acidobacteriota bacterium]